MSGKHNAHAKELSRLCRIKLTSEEERTLSENIENILSYMDQIEEIDTDGIPTCTTVLPTAENVFGDDEPSEIYDRNTFLANSPDQVGGMIKIPPVLESET